MESKPWWKQRTTWSALALLINQLVKLWLPGQQLILQTVDLVLGTFTVIFLRQGVENAGRARAQAQAPGDPEGPDREAA